MSRHLKGVPDEFLGHTWVFKRSSREVSSRVRESYKELVNITY